MAFFNISSQGNWSRTTDHLSIEIALYFGILGQSFMDHNVEDHSTITEDEHMDLDCVEI